MIDLQKMKTLSIICIFILSLAACNQQPKQTVSEPQTTTKDTLTTAQAQQLFGTCTTCHGKQAEGNIGMHAPALANQDAWYLEKQLSNFKNGIRGYDQRDTAGRSMATIASSFTDTAMITGVIKYIKTLPTIPVAANIPGNIKAGMSHYNMICGACHGQQAEGIESLHSPKLTGIEGWYLVHQLKNFRAGLRGSHPMDKNGAQMQSMAKTLQDEQAVKDVVSYILSLQQKEL